MSLLLQGRYRILETIGQTPNGAVHLCADLRLDERRWAVKELALGDPAMRARFEGEAALLSRLRHPKLPVIVDFFWEGERAWLVREYIEGQTLFERISGSGPAREKQALEWALEMAEVLQYLHSQDPPVVYRDLKPQNVVITEDGLKLIDFGLARPLEGGFAAPEQQATPLADLYALGATVYYCLMGRPPSANQTLPPGLKPETQSLLRRCLEPDPESRLSAATLVEDLQKRLGRTPDAPLPKATPVRPLPPEKPLTHRPRDRISVHPDHLPSWYRAILTLASLLFLVGLGGGAALLGPRASSPHKPLPAAGPVFPGEEVARLPRVQAQERVQAWLAQYPHDPWALLLQTNLAAATPALRVPVIAPMSGLERESGQWMVSGLLEAEREVNASPGEPITFEVHNTMGEQARTLQVASEICADPEVLVAVGPYSSQHTLLVAPVVDGAGLPLISPVAADPRVSDSGPYVFTVADSNRRRVEVVARYLCQGRSQGVILAADGNYLSRSMTEFFSEEAAKLGCRLLPTLTYSQDRPDVPGLASSVREVRPDFVFIADNRGRLVGDICTALRQAGVDCPLGTQVVPGSPGLLAAGPAVEGLVMSTFFDPDQAEPPGQALAQRLHALLGDVYLNHAITNSYDAGVLLGEVLRRCKTRAEVQAYLASFGDSRPPVQGVSGRFTLRNPQELRTVMLMRIANGRYSSVKKG